MAAREDVLAALRRAAPRETPLPDLAGLGVRLDDRAGQFATTVAAVGGACVRVADLGAAVRVLADLPVWRDAKMTLSLVPGLPAGTVDPTTVAGPHALAGLEVAVLPGELGVAENGAVWIDGAALPHRAAFVIAEHLVLVVEARVLVDDMHQAYAQLERRPAGFGVFVAGPSKTADIEQALVIGAHGARSCTVLLVGPGA